MRPLSGWIMVLVTAVALGLIALASNLTSVEQMSGQADGIAAARKTFSKLANAGVVWAGLSWLAGWLVRRPWPAVAAGVLAPLIALTVHYGVADVFDLMPWATLGDNSSWFIAALIFGPPLGLVGALARRGDLLGLLARLPVPLGAVIEPFFASWIPPQGIDIWANRVSGVIAGSALIAGGLFLGAVLLRSWGRPVGADGASTVGAGG